MSTPKSPRKKKRVTHADRVLKTFAGRTVSPRIVAPRLGVDRAAACRILQSLVRRGAAQTGAYLGDYVIPKA